VARGLSPREFIASLRDSGVLAADDLDAALAECRELAEGTDAGPITKKLVSAGKLTPYQVAAISDRRFDLLKIGAYQVLDRLGEGGMGTVYKARHERMKRLVAIKVLARNVAESEAFLQRFQREVETVAKLSHPNIVMAFDAGESALGPYLVMEFVDGRDLATDVRLSGPLAVQPGIDVVIQAARGLGYAHGQGIIHRDIKPANLIRDNNGTTKVADLGLARLSSALTKPGDAGSLTQAGNIVGTVDFLPPEQALDSTSIDHRADIYSLGCTFYYLLTARPPYEAETVMAALLKHRDAPIPLLSAARGIIPPALDGVFARMVAKKPEDRYQSMAEVIEALESVPKTAMPAATNPDMMQTMVTTGPHGLTPQSMPALTSAAHSFGQPDSAVRGTILLVEPSRTQSLIIKKYVQELGGTNIVTTATGNDALKQVESSQPMTVISAMHLADMTGLELAQKLRAAANHGTGFILVTSASQAGELSAAAQQARVVMLPKPFDLSALRQALKAANAGARQSTGPGTPRVLIVDDSVPARSHMRAVLADLGLRDITECPDGADAIKLLAAESFDLIVTDYHMPRCTGPELIAFIRQKSKNPQVAVIMATTETDSKALDAVQRLGVSAITDKSLKRDIVRGIIAQIKASSYSI
jgi:serine/threonine-protein kinase